MASPAPRRMEVAERPLGRDNPDAGSPATSWTPESPSSARLSYRSFGAAPSSSRPDSRSGPQRR